MSESFELEDLGNGNNPPAPELEDDYDDDTSEDDPGNIRWHTPIGQNYEDYEDTSNLIDPREPNSGGRPFNITSFLDYRSNIARDTMSIDLFGDRIHDAIRIDGFI